MAVFEYAVDFQPAVDGKMMRIGLINSQREALGNTLQFDGAKLWLPIRLPATVSYIGFMKSIPKKYKFVFLR